MISDVSSSPGAAHESISRPGTVVITSASGDVQTYKGCGAKTFQPSAVRPSSAACSLDSESNCAFTFSAFSATSGLYNLTTRLCCARQIGCGCFDWIAKTVAWSPSPSREITQPGSWEASVKLWSTRITGAESQARGTSAKNASHRPAAPTKFPTRNP